MIFSKFHPDSPEYAAEMLNKARGATIREGNNVRQIEGTRDTGQDKHEALMLAAARGSRVIEDGVARTIGDARIESA
jgi:hypothetical protein